MRKIHTVVQKGKPVQEENKKLEVMNYISAASDSYPNSLAHGWEKGTGQATRKWVVQNILMLYYL